MLDLRKLATGAGFQAFKITRAHRVLRPFTGGFGAILMMHHVRPGPEPDFAPNLPLIITPAFLEVLIETIRGEGLAIVDLDTAIRLINQGAAPSRFAVLTFDDGFQDLYDHALPVLRKHSAPFTVYITPGLVDRHVRPWWIDLEHLIRQVERFELNPATDQGGIATNSVRGKYHAFTMARNVLRRSPPWKITEQIEAISRAHGVGTGEVDTCMEWETLAALAADPLCTIGSHSMTHAMLSMQSDNEVRDELQDGKRIIEQRLGIAVDHLAYPFGDAAAVGAREFRIAREVGYRSATTTRPGMITLDCVDRPTALPRLSVSGLWQDRKCLQILLTGAPFAITKHLGNLGRRARAPPPEIMR